MQRELADVLVIGSGAAGAAVTKRLTDLGANVVCLEQGGWIHPNDYPSTKPNWEIQLHRGRFNFSPNVRKRWEDYPVKRNWREPARRSHVQCSRGEHASLDRPLPAFSSFRLSREDIGWRRGGLAHHL